MKNVSVRQALIKVMTVIIALSLLTGMVPVFAAGSTNPVVSVVNFDPVYGDKEANIAAMTRIIEEAAESGTDIIIFPELAVTGYASGNVTMPVELAESKDGETAAYFSVLARAYDMYIVYGAPETVEGDAGHAYNSAFACTPDGYVDSYQKMLVADEGEWCAAGSTPVYFDTEFGKVALSVGDDTYDLVELMRAYAADGCFLIASPSSIEVEDYTETYSYDNAVYCDYTTGYYYFDWTDYNFNRMYNIGNMTGIYVATGNLIGTDGENDEFEFGGGAMLVGANSSSESGKANEWTKHIDEGVDYIYNIMKTYAGDESSTETLYTASISTSLASASLVKSSLYQPNLYAEWYSELANGVTITEPASDEDPIVAVVNMSPAYMDKAANTAEMLAYVEQAAEQGVNIIVFPEMALTDYVSSSNSSSQNYKDVLANAEALDGEYAARLEEAAAEYGMYVIYGTAEVNPDDESHPYNSAFVATPDGETLTYRKIHPVEGTWPTYGTEPLIIETPWGKLGISICKDTYSYPELAHYYAVAGCTIMANVTASGSYAGANFIYNTSMSCIASRDSMAILSSDLVNYSGINNSSLYPGKSTIITTNGISPIYLTDESMTAETMYVAELDMSELGFSIEGYNAAVMAEAYEKLAAGEPIYDGSGLIEAPVSYISGTTAEGKCGDGETATFDVVYSGEDASSIRFQISSDFPVLSVESSLDCEFNPVSGKVIVYNVSDGITDGDVIATVTVDLNVTPWAADGINYVQLAVLEATNMADEDFTVYSVPAEIIISNVYLLGDVNCDGAVSNADVVLLARYLVDLESLGDTALANADYNQDGTVGNIDLVKLARALIG